MSENVNTGTGTANTEPEPISSVANQVIEAVMDLIDALDNFAPVRRGALGSGAGLSCESATSSIESVFLSKEKYVYCDLTLNGKNADLELLSETLGRIVDTLTMAKSYPSGVEWEIVDISHGTPVVPMIIGREENNDWIMAAGVIVKYYRKEI